MSLYDYQKSQEIDRQGYPFYALIMAAMRKADSNNLVMLQTMWPTVWKDLQARYYAPGGILDSDSQTSPCQTQG